MAIITAIRFSSVGAVSTAVHVLVAYLSNQLFDATPAVSNLVGFIAAATVSFMGHSRWTFMLPTLEMRKFGRFLVLSLLSLLLTHSIVHVITAQMKYPLIIALSIIVLTVPLLNYLIMKVWVFTESMHKA